MLNVVAKVRKQKDGKSVVDFRPTLVAIFCCVLKIVVNQGKMILNIPGVNYGANHVKAQEILMSSSLSWRVVGFCNFHLSDKRNIKCWNIYRYFHDISITFENRIIQLPNGTSSAR